MDASFVDSNLFNYGILPLLIFLSRVGGVTIGTIRIIFVSKGKKYLAPILVFFEVFIWILAISRITFCQHAKIEDNIKQQDETRNIRLSTLMRIIREGFGKHLKLSVEWETLSALLRM